MSDYDPEQARAHEDLCRFLAACYYEPGPEFTEEKLFDSMLTAASRLHPALAEHARKLGQAFAAQDLQTLLVDYSRLFMGPMEALAKPYGSSWLNAPASNGDNPPPAVLALYSEGGFELDPEFMELPDHVAVELEFLYLLIYTKNQAMRDGNAEAVSASDSLRQRFLVDHLGAWVGPFSVALANGAGTAFYRELALLTERFVQMESGAPKIH